MNIHYFFKSKTGHFTLVKKISTFCIMMCLLALQAQAQVPLNDNPCNGSTLSAIPLPVNAACAYLPFKNTDASNSTIPGSIPTTTCIPFDETDVWFTVTVPAGATSVTIKTVGAIVSGTPAIADGGLSIYTATGTCPSLVMTEIGCNDDGPLNGSMPILTVNAAAGTLLFVRFGGVVGETGGFNICATANIPPANNECANAQSLTVNANLLCGVVAAGTCASATLSTTTPAPTCGNANTWDDDVWYKFVATGATHTVSLLNVVGSSTAMVINLYSVPPGGDCTNLTFVNCTVGSTANVGSLTPGTTYYVRVHTNVINAASNTTFNICIGTPPPPPANDECLNAVMLPVNADFNCALVTAGTTVSATQSANTPTPTCSATNGWNDDVWYTFVATNTSHRVSLLNVVGSSTDMAMQIYSGNCTALTAVLCSDPDVANLTGLTIGATYYVRVMTWSATTTLSASFNICVGTPPPPPPNNDCTGAVSLTVNPNYACGVVTAGTTISATNSTLAPAPTCSVGGQNDDVWFSFQASGPSHRISLLNIVGSTTAMTTIVYSGTCGTGTLTQLVCNTNNIFNVTGLTAGQVYYVRVFTTSTTAGLDANFSICVGTPPPPPPNDECTGAIPLTVNANQLCGVTTAGTTAGATQSATLPTPTCSGPNGWDDDVWYSFVAVSNNHTISLTNVTGLTTNMLTSVYQGTCGSLTQIACATVDPNFITMSTLTPGTTYYVRVQTELTGQDANFNVCIGTPGPGAVCSAGNPFCSTSGVTYPSVTNQPSLGGNGVYGCLGSTPNPTWFVMQVATPGNLVFQVSQTGATGGIDVDYAAWGPFTSQTDGCTQIGATPATITPISCSFSTAALETITIPNAQVGQWYVVLITNFNGSPGTITFNSTTGNVGSTNCNIVCNTTASNNGPACVSGSFNLTSTAITGSTFTWTGPGFTSTMQNPLNVTAPSAPGSYTYNVTATVGAVACSASTIVVVTAPPPVPTVVTPITYCQNATATALTATVTTPGNTLLYYSTPTGGTGVTVIVPSTATVSSTTYYVSQKAGNCEGPRTPIVVNVVATTTPAVTISGSPLSYCQGATAVSLAPNATAAAGGTLVWYTASTGGTGSATPIIPSTTASGTTSYYVSQIIGTCEGPRSPIVVTVLPASPAPTVTTPLTYCQGTTTIPTLNATGTNILWWGINATGGSSSTTAPVLSSTTAGTFTYYVTQNSNTCISTPRTPIVVNVTATPLAPTIVTPVTYCQNATAIPLSASTGAGFTLTWYATAAATTGSATAPTPSTASVGSTQYFVGASNGVCVGPRVAITVTVNATPAAPTVTPTVTYCQGATALPLAANGTNLLWYTQAAPGGTSSTTAPTPSTTSVGTTSYYVSATTGTCEGPRAIINVVVNPTPVAPTVTTPVAYCQNATASQLTASGIGSLLWYTQAAPGGTSSTTAPTPSTTTGGSTNYYVSSIQGVCEGPRSLITINVTTLPAAPVVTTPVVYCQAATSVPLVAPGTSLLWYTQPAPGGASSTTAPTPSTLSSGNTSYYVSQSTTGSLVCEGPRAAIVVTVNPKPLAPVAPSPINLCQTVTPTALTATGTNLLWYTQAAPGGTSSTTAIIPSVSATGTSTYYVSQSALNCEGPRTPIVVNVKAGLIVDAGANVTIARGATTQLLGVVTNAIAPSYLWSTTSTNLALTSAIILNPIANPIQTTTYKLTVSDPTGPCPAISANVTVTVVQSCINVRNAFTPNGDGKNDLWLVYDQNFCLATNGCTVHVFNRYGSKVYESIGYQSNWDGTFKGKPLPDGTYYAVVDFVLFDGSKQTVRTDVTILR